MEDGFNNNWAIGVRGVPLKQGDSGPGSGLRGARRKCRGIGWRWSDVVGRRRTTRMRRGLLPEEMWGESEGCWGGTNQEGTKKTVNSMLEAE